jgi:collagenase-like PrtC family protease/UDP:flavonoid glycosyltransferase YjiC (YdhE family)
MIALALLPSAMYCAFCNIEGLGHTVPTLAVAKAFRDEGHRVVYLSHRGSTPTHRKIGESGLPVEYLPGDGADDAESERKAVLDAADVLRSRRADLLFSGSLHYRGALAGELAGVPEVRLFPNPFIQTETSNVERLETSSAPNHWKDWAARVNALRAELGMAPRPFGRLLESSFANVLLVDPTVPGLVTTDPRTIVSGPVLERTVRLAPRTPGSRTQVFLTIGTEVSHTEAGRRFLARMLREYAAMFAPPFDLRVYVGTEDHGDVSPPQNSHLRVLRGLVDQQREIASADLVVSHGGWNTVHEAVLFGRPQIVVPFEGHQPLTGRWVEEQGLGVSLPAEHFALSAVGGPIRSPGVAEFCRKFSSRAQRQALVDRVERQLLDLHPLQSERPIEVLPRSRRARALRSGVTLACGVASLTGLELAVKSGAQEVFCGLQDPDESSAFLRILNRREMRSANFTSLSDFDACLARAHDLGIRVAVVVNEIFTAEQHGALRRHLELLARRPIDALVVSDLALLLLLRHEYPEHFTIHLGVGALALNTRSVGFYVEKGARRIVLSRKIFTHEIASIRRAFPHLELEAFMEVGGYCPNLDGLCNFLHNNFLCPTEGCSRIESAYSIGHEVDHSSCKLCAIWDYSRLGIDVLKLATRDKRPEETARLAELVQELWSLAATTTKEDFVRRTRHRLEAELGVGCAVAEGCHCSQAF